MIILNSWVSFWSFNSIKWNSDNLEECCHIETDVFELTIFLYRILIRLPHQYALTRYSGLDVWASYSENTK